MKVLVTGFDPFGGETVNPAFEAVKLIPDNVCGAEVIKIEIPTVFAKGPKAVEDAIAEHDPDVIICVGQAGGRAGISLEKVAINLRDCSMPDNEGNKLIDEPIAEDGDTAYFTKLPVKAMRAYLEEKGIPVHLSYTGGTYVCNDVMYSLLYLLDKKYPDKKGGFIHVPFDTSQVIGKPITTPSMPIETIAKGLTYAIEAILKNENDIVIAGGATH